MGNTTPPLGGVNKSVGNFEGAPYSEQQRPTVREGGCARERMCPREVPTQDAKGHRAVAALSTPSGQMAGGGQGTVGGSPHAHRGLRHSQQGSWRPTEQGAPRRSPRGGLRAPSRCALHREVSRTRFSGGACPLILPGGTRPTRLPSRIILERINYEIVN